MAASGDEESDAESAYDLPIVRFAEKPYPASIYTFLGLATLPRLLRRHNPLRRLPREIVLRIARLAHVPQWYATLGDEEVAAAVDATDYIDVVLKTRPIRTGVHYVEVSVGCAWYGTRVWIEGVLPGQGRIHEASVDGGVSLERAFGMYLNQSDSTGNDCVWFLSDHDPVRVAQEIPAFGERNGRASWTWGKAPVIFGVLVDMARGCATLRLNGIDGPCVSFPGDLWRRGVRIVVEDFPDLAGEEVSRHVTGDVSRYPRCVVSCETPPIPVSLLEAAADPMTVAEHLAAGSLLDTDDTPAQEL